MDSIERIDYIQDAILQYEESNPICKNCGSLESIIYNGICECCYLDEIDEIEKQNSWT